MELTMKPDNIDRIRNDHRAYYDQSIDSLPDGWFTIVSDFLHIVKSIGDLTDSVSVRFERTPSGCKAFCFPEMSRWHPEQSIALRVAQRSLYGLSQQTCEMCGNSGERHGHTVLCNEHKDDAEAKVQREDALYNEVAVLFPEGHGSRINLAVPAYLEPVLAKTLRDVLVVVLREDLAGAVQITMIEMREGMLFTRHRYTGKAQDHIAAQADIDDHMRHLDRQSEELWRKHGGDGDAA
jgi:hypothetical protein